MVWSQELVKKSFFFGSSETALSNFRKPNIPSFMMSGLNVSEVRNAGAISFTVILAKKKLGSILGYQRPFCSQLFILWKFYKNCIFGPMAILVIQTNTFFPFIIVLYLFNQYADFCNKKKWRLKRS